MAAEHEDFYKRLRKRVHKWARSKEGRRSEYADYVLLAPDIFHLLVRLSLDKEVPVKEKAKLAVAIAYFLSPIDLLPEVIIGPIGYLDDVGLAVFVIQSILKETDEQVVTRHWAGDEDLLVVVRSFMEKADRMLGSGLWGRLRKLVEPGKSSRGRAAAQPPASPTRSDAARATEREMAEPTEKKPVKAAEPEDPQVDQAGPEAKKKAAAKKATKKSASKKTAKKRSSGTKKASKADKESE